MWALFIMYYFEMGIMVYNARISQIMVYKALLWTDALWISYIKWYKLYNNNLSVVLRSKQGGKLKLMNTRTKRQFNCWLVLSLSLNCLVYFTEITFCLLWSHLRMRLFYDMKSNLYNVFILKCVSITNISIEHFTEGVIR